MPENTTPAEGTPGNDGNEQEAVVANPFAIAEPEDYEARLREETLAQQEKDGAAEEDDAGGDTTGGGKAGDEKGGSPVVLRAKGMGFTDEQIAKFGGDENLASALTVVDTQIAAAGAIAGRQPGGPEGVPGGASTETKQGATVTPPAPAAPAVPEALKLEFDDDLIDPHAKEIINKVVDHFSKGLGALQAEVVALHKEREDVAAQEIVRDFERFLGTLVKNDDRWKEVFGEGATHTLDPNSMAAKERQKLFAHADALGIGLASRGMTVPENDELHDRALKSLYAEKIASFAVREIGAQAKKREGQRVGVPSRSKGGGEPAMTAEQRAVRNMHDIMRKHGHVGATVEGDEDNVGFL